MPRYRYISLLAICLLLAAGVAQYNPWGVLAQDDAAPPAGDADKDYCIACHTSEALLRELAVEEETESTLSQGPG